MPDLQPFNSGETATSIRTKINAAIARINTLDDANEIIAKLDAELGSTAWKNSIITLNTIAELKAFDVGTVVDKTVAVVYGSSAAGDGEGGTFYWDQSSAQSADGVTTIAPNSGDSGRWIKVQVALSGVDIQATIVEEDSYDGSLADIGAIKDWVESNSTTSDLEYVGIAEYDGSPTIVNTTGSMTKISDLEFESKAAALDTEITYDVSKFITASASAVQNIRFVHITCSLTSEGTAPSGNVQRITVTYPDGTVVDLANTAPRYNTYIGTTIASTYVIPVNSDTTEFTINAATSFFVNEGVAFKIVGATVVRNASGFLGDQVYGGSGMLYSGTEVYNATPTGNTWIPLNIKPLTSKGGRTLCYFKVAGAGGFSFKTGGESENVASTIAESAFGGGTSAAQNQGTNISYVAVISDSDTVVEFASLTEVPVVITLEAYQPLDDSPVVTRHYLGDIEFIDAVTIVNKSDDIRTDTGWRTVQPNMAWAGASTLIIEYMIQDNDINADYTSVSFRANATSVEIKSGNGTGAYGPKTSQMLIPVSTGGSWQWNYTGGDSYLADLRVVGYVKSNPIRESYPYFNVMIDQRPGLTTPAEFTDASQDTLTEYKLPSYGSITTGFQNHYHQSENSLLYEMSVNALSDTDIVQKLFAVDDVFSIYVDGVLKATADSVNSTSAPMLVTYTLTAGLHTISIVKNDVGGVQEALDLVGDIISDTVQFVGFSGVTGILDDIKGTVDHETVPTSLAVQEYVANVSGVNQTWKLSPSNGDIQQSPNWGGFHTNTSDAPIQLSIRAWRDAQDNVEVNIEVDGYEWAVLSATNSGGGVSGVATVTIPPKAEYRFKSTGETLGSFSVSELS